MRRIGITLRNQQKSVCAESRLDVGNTTPRLSICFETPWPIKHSISIRGPKHSGNPLMYLPAPFQFPQQPPCARTPHCEAPADPDFAE